MATINHVSVSLWMSLRMATISPAMAISQAKIAKRRNCEALALASGVA